LSKQLFLAILVQPACLYGYLYFIQVMQSTAADNLTHLLQVCKELVNMQEQCHGYISEQGVLTFLAKVKVTYSIYSVRPFQVV